jgi:hypothetical protein
MIKSKNSNDLNNIFENLPFNKDDVKKNQVLLELINITVSMRDEFKKNENYTLTIEDTRLALDALSAHMDGKKFTVNLSNYQKKLADRLIDAVIIFKLK